MPDNDLEDGPDPNDIRRHAKRMYTELQYRQKYRRIDFYRPNNKQREFHNSTARETMLRANNQGGKTHGAGAQMAMDAIAFYPDWYEGHRFLTPPKIERPNEWMGWAACTSQVKTRDGAQLKLLGPVGEQNGLGTGMIPLDNIKGRPSMSRGASDCVDSVQIARETGGAGIIRFKTYAMGREAFQGEPVDLVWLDEDVSKEDPRIYGECLARLITTRGRIILSMTPLLGPSPIRMRFKQKLGPSMDDISMNLYDCAVSKNGHILDEEIATIEAETPENERATRIYGADMQGEGAVFTTPVDRIRHTLDPADVPTYWPWIWGVDFTHGGLSLSSHPFAGVLACWDRDNDVVRIMHALKLPRQLPVNHVDAMKRHPFWEAPVAWPHDGGTHTAHGITIKETYKKLGLNMLPTHATFDKSLGGGFDFEDGIEEMDRRFASGRLLVAKHLAEYFDEYLGYYRDNGLVKKVNDDLLSATRQIVMQLRSAKTLEQARAKLASRNAPQAVAQDIYFPLF